MGKEIENRMKEAIIETFEKEIRNLARSTAFIEKTGIMTKDEATEFINVMGRRYGEKYGNMSPEMILLDLKLENAINSVIRGIAKESEEDDVSDK